VVAGALASACCDSEVLARLGGALGDAVRAAAATAPDRATRVRWAEAARAPVPAGLRSVDPSWIEAGLAGLPERARIAVAAGGGSDVEVWLARWATAGIPDLPAATASRVTTIASVTRVDAGALTSWLADAGADQLALALGAAGHGAIAAAARIVGDRLVTAAARIALPPRADALGPARAAIARCRVALDDRALVRIGARAVASYVDALARRQIMHRLPRALGLIIGDELAMPPGPSGDAPSWPALVG
jgi:hypothetical protein